MASKLDEFVNRPKWQLALLWLLFSGIIAGAWYSLYFEEALQQHKAAETALKNDQAELVRVKERLANFEQEMAEAKAMEQELEEKKRQLPLSSATVDHLMRKFQQQGRLVGVSVDNWTPAPETKLDFYAQMPINIAASGTWLQFGEFFRRISELEQIVNIQGVAMKQVGASGNQFPDTTELEVKFVASTFRFIEQDDRTPRNTNGGGSKSRSARQGGGN